MGFLRSVFRFLRGDVTSVMAGFNVQKQIVSALLDRILGFIPRVRSAWIGGDADEFAADVQRKLVPALRDLIAAIGGINVNLEKAIGIVDQADRACRSVVANLSDRIARI